MRTEYRNELDQIRWTAEGRAALVRSLSARQEAGPRPRRALRMAALAAALACALAVTVGAVVVGLPVLEGHFGGSAGYAQSSALIGRSVTSEGWTMTLTDCAGDDRYLILGFELEAPEGTVLEQQYRPLHNRPEFPGGVGVCAWQWRQLPDGDPSDNRLRFGLWIENIQDEVGDPGLNGQTMELRIDKLQYTRWNADKGEWEKVTAFDGAWDFGSLVLSYPDRTLRMDPDLPVTVLGVPAVITHLEVSPIGLDVWFEGDALKGHDGWYPWGGQCVAEPEITLYDKDGSALIPDKYTPFGIRGGSGCNGNPNLPEEEEYYFLNIIQSYGYLLDMDSLDHVDICGVSISLDGGAP